jgi:hypothetical protein
MHERLKALEERMKGKVFEDLLERLLKRSRRSPVERFGAHPEMEPFEHTEDPISREARFECVPDSFA